MSKYENASCWNVFIGSIVAFLSRHTVAQTFLFCLKKQQQPVFKSLYYTLTSKAVMSRLLRSLKMWISRVEMHSPSYVLIHTFGFMRAWTLWSFRDNLGCFPHQYIHGIHWPSGRTVLELRIGDEPVTGHNIDEAICRLALIHPSFIINTEAWLNC